MSETHADPASEQPRRSRNQSKVQKPVEPSFDRSIAEYYYDQAFAKAKEVAESEKKYNSSSRELLKLAHKFILSVVSLDELRPFRRYWDDPDSKQTDKFSFIGPVMELFDDKGIEPPNIRGANPFRGVLQHFIGNAKLKLRLIKKSERDDDEKLANDIAEQRRVVTNENVMTGNYALLLLAAIDMEDEKWLDAPFSELATYRKERETMLTLSAKLRVKSPEEIEAEKLARAKKAEEEATKKARKAEAKARQQSGKTWGGSRTEDVHEEEEEGQEDSNDFDARTGINLGSITGKFVGGGGFVTSDQTHTSKAPAESKPKTAEETTSSDETAEEPASKEKRTASLDDIFNSKEQAQPAKVVKSVKKAADEPDAEWFTFEKPAKVKMNKPAIDLISAKLKETFMLVCEMEGSELIVKGVLHDQELV